MAARYRGPLFAGGGPTCIGGLEVKRAALTADNPEVVAVALPYPAPTWWDGVAVRRVGAGLVDLGVAAGAAALALAAAAALAPASAPTGLSTGIAALVLALPLSCFVVGEARFGTTAGKRLLGLEVRRPDGGRPGWRRAGLRLLLRLSPLSWAGVVWGGLRRTEPWHDGWSSTVVVRRTTAGRPGPVTRPLANARPLAGARQAARPLAGAQHAARLQHPAGRHLRLLSAVPPEPLTSRPGPPEPSGLSGPRWGRPPRRRRTAGRPRPGSGRSLVALPAPDAGSGAPAVDGPAASGPGRCRCDEVPRLTGGEAVRYACGHLLAVRRWPGAGSFALVCPTTRVAWLAHDEWADRSGEATLIRLAALPDPVTPSPTSPPPDAGR